MSELPDARISVGLPDHRKTLKLERRLGAAGFKSLICLILAARVGRPSGDLSGMTDEDIEIDARWGGDHGHFVSSMKEVGFLDGRKGSYKIHDWEVWQPFSVGAVERSLSATRAALMKEVSKGVKTVGDVDKIMERKRKILCAAHAEGMPFASAELAEAERTASAAHALEHAPSKRDASGPVAERMPGASPAHAPFPSPSPIPYPDPDPDPTPLPDPKSKAGGAAENRPVVSEPTSVGTSPPPPKNSDLAPRRRPPRDEVTSLAAQLPGPATAVWDAYAAGYTAAYGEPPVRNDRAIGICRQLIQRLGQAEAEAVAQWYPSHRDRWYTVKGHGIDQLLRDAEKLRTEWVTSRTMTAHLAGSIDRTASNPFAAMLAERRRAGVTISATAIESVKNETGN